LLCCCCSSSWCWGVINQNTAIFANFVQFHHAFRHSQNIALLSNFTMHSAALLGSLAQQPCPAVRPISTEFDARARSAVTALYYSGRSPNCMRALLHCPDRFKLVFSPISPFFYYLSARAAVQQTGSNLFSCSYVDLFRSLLQVFFANAGKD
jgi:hypothetical protein